MSGAGSLPVGCLAWQDPVLESPGSVVGLTVTPPEGSCRQPLPKTAAPGALVPRASPCHAPLCRRASNTSRQVWFRLLRGHCCFPLGQIPLAFKARFPWGSPVPFSDPQAGKPDVGLRTFTTVGGLLRYNCSSVCGAPIERVRGLILSWLHSSYCLIVGSPSPLLLHTKETITKMKR